jgi:hypothetical protein
MFRACLLSIAIVISLPTLTSCKKKKDEDINNVDCSKINSSYSSDIKPIIESNCLSSGCHNANSSNGDFTTYAGVKAKADNGSLDSRVIQQKNMPPSGALPMDQLKKIKCWLSAGAPNN